jgi:methyl-accepting chemotaxis protein
MKYKRRIFLIDKPFQLRFSLYTVTWIAALGIAYPLIIQNLVESLIRVLRVAVDGPGLDQLTALKSTVTQQLIISQIGAVTVVFVISIFVSHRIAGPIYKLRKFFEGLAKGNFADELKFRKTDYFQNLADDYNTMLKGLRAHYSQTFEPATSALGKLEACVVKSGEARAEVEQAISLLKELQARTPRN